MEPPPKGRGEPLGGGGLYPPAQRRGGICHFVFLSVW